MDVRNGFTRVVQQAEQRWMALPPPLRSERVLAGFGALVAFVLLLGFHQVVIAAVERASARDQAAFQKQRLAAICSIERNAQARSLCLLTAPSAARRTDSVAVATR
jgi:type II secretory pathway component PulM